jgi:pimeloyl-ACP methyl ester carboxylesterase
MQELIDVGTAKLAYRKTGTGPDLVFVHGWPLHGETWRAIVPRLADRYTCHVFDLPGTGRSEWAKDTRINLRAHAVAVLTAIETLGLDRVGFVGHDSGGAIARVAAAELGTRCFGLALGNTEIPGHAPPGLVWFVRIGKMPGGLSLLPMILRSKRLRRSNIGLGGAFHDLAFIDGEFGEMFVKPLLSDKRAAAGQLRMIRHWEWDTMDAMAATHAKITAPVQLIWGARDPWFPVTKARAMVDQFPGGAELAEIPDGKVFVHEERPDVWAAHAGRFFDRVVAQEAGARERLTLRR